MGCILRCRVRNVIASVKAIYSAFILPVVFPEDQIHSIIYRCTKLKLNKANQDYLKVLHSGQETLNTNLLYENTTPWFLSIFSTSMFFVPNLCYELFKQQNSLCYTEDSKRYYEASTETKKVLRDQSWPVLLS